MLLLDLSFSPAFNQGFRSSLHSANPRTARNMQPAFLRANKEESKREPSRWNPHVFYDLILEVTHFHFCHMLSVTQTNPGIIWEETPPGYEYWEVGPIGDYLGAGHHIKWMNKDPQRKLPWPVYPISMRRVPHKYSWPLIPSCTTCLIWECGTMVGDSHWSRFLDWREWIYLNFWVKMPSSFWTSSRQKSWLSESTSQT